MSFSASVRAAAFSVAAILSVDSAAQADTFRTVTSKQDFLSIVNGRSLAIPLYGVDLRVSGNGRISGKGGGKPVSGQWSWSGGYFCRDLSWGQRDLGPNCQQVQVDGQSIRFTSDRGAGRSAVFRIR